MEEKSMVYYEKVRQSEIKWVSEFIENLPRLPKAEKEKMIALVPDIQVDTIGNINVLVRQSKRISDKNKQLFMKHLQSVEWFDWQPGETYRAFNGHIWARMTPQWLSDALIESYYAEAEPEERARYETQKEIDRHPRKIKGMTQEQYDEYRDSIYQKLVKKYTREWKKKQAEYDKLTKQEENTVTEPPQHIPPKIELYEETQEGAYYQYTLNLDENAGQGGEPLYKAEKIAHKMPKVKDYEDPMQNSERLPVLNFNRQYMNNTKLSRILSTKQIDITEDEFNLNITEKVVNLVNIWQDDHITLTNTNISPFDMAVLDATYTIMQQGPMLITPEWIVRVMSGNMNANYITQKKVQAVMDSINKLQFVRIKIDCTEEYNAYQLKKRQKPAKWWGYESYLLPVGKVEARFDANGKKVVAYKILEKPALYRYAEMNKQIVDVPAYLLETQGQFSDTEEAVLIKRYVIKRVAQIVKRNSLSNNKVSFLWFDRKEDEERGLFPELGYIPDNTPAWRKKKAKINEIVKGTLKTLQEGNAITKFEEYREDGTKNPASPIAGYKIYYDKKQSSLPIK